MERISVYQLYYVIAKLVCKTHSGVTWREFRKHSQKLLNMVKTRCKYPKRGQFSKKVYAIQYKNSEFREQFENLRYVRHATNGHFYKSKWTTVICDGHLIKVN